MVFGVPIDVFYLLIFLWGAGGGITMSMSRSIVQESAPPSHRARVMSVYSLGMMGGMPMGSLAMGYVIGVFGPLNAAWVPVIGMARRRCMGCVENQPLVADPASRCRAGMIADEHGRTGGGERCKADAVSGRGDSNATNRVTPTAARSRLNWSKRVGHAVVPPPIPLVADIELRAPRITIPSALQGWVTAEKHERIVHTHGGHSLELLQAMRGDFRSPPDAVAHPRTEAELEATLAWCD